MTNEEIDRLYRRIVEENDYLSKHKKLAIRRFVRRIARMAIHDVATKESAELAEYITALLKRIKEDDAKLESPHLDSMCR